MADDIKVVFSPHNDLPVKLFDADRGHAHEPLLFRRQKRSETMIWAATRTTAEPAMIAATGRTWRRKPASWLEYWSGGPRTKAAGYHQYCHHQSSLKLERPSPAGSARRWMCDGRGLVS
jgi:hypothetical protein